MPEEIESLSGSKKLSPSLTVRFDDISSALAAPASAGAAGEQGDRGGESAAHRDQRRLQLGLEAALGHRADDPLRLAAVLEQDQGRDREHLVGGRRSAGCRRRSARRSRGPRARRRSPRGSGGRRGTDRTREPRSRRARACRNRARRPGRCRRSRRKACLSLRSPRCVWWLGAVLGDPPLLYILKYWSWPSRAASAKAYATLAYRVAFAAASPAPATPPRARSAGSSSTRPRAGRGR